MKKRITRKKQCLKCPWRVDVNPYDIPNYIPEKHLKLKNTMLTGMEGFGKSRRVMSCHELEGVEGDYCVGWLIHQLTVGNDIGLRLKMRDYDLSDVELIGEQHGTFEDTLPKDFKEKI